MAQQRVACCSYDYTDWFVGVYYLNKSGEHAIASIVIPPFFLIKFVLKIRTSRGVIAGDRRITLLPRYSLLMFNSLFPRILNGIPLFVISKPSSHTERARVITFVN